MMPRSQLVLMAARGVSYRQISQWQKARRSASGTADQVRADHQLESRQADRAHDSAECARAGRPGHKMTVISGGQVSANHP